MLYGLLFGGVSFTQEKDIPDQSEKVIFITGGKEFSQYNAKQKGIC